MSEILIDTTIDILKLFPFLFITYIFLEYLEHKTSDKFMRIVHKSGCAGPIVGSILGAVPQCGFSVVAANFYAARIIGLGTLIAIFLSTSDEILPIFISSGLNPLTIIYIILGKIVYAVFCGYLLYFTVSNPQNHHIDIETLCKNEGCHCEHSIIHSALRHSIKITLFIFIVTLIINTTFLYIKPHELANYLQKPILGEFLSGIFGLLPNCSSSVILAQLYMEKYINVSSFMSGSFVNAGVGLLVLFRVNKHIFENIKITLILYICGVCGGLLCHFVL